MKFRAEIDVMPLDALLDPQGKAVTGSMKTLGLEMIDGVRIGKHIRLFIEADSKATATEKVKRHAQDCFLTKSWKAILIVSKKHNSSIFVI